MRELRKPLFIVALVLIVLVVLAEMGTSLILGGEEVNRAQLEGLLADAPADAELSVEDLLTLRAENETPPGLGVPYLAFLDGLLLLTIALMGAALLVPERVHGRVQGGVTLVVSLLVLLGSVVAIFAALTLVMVMLGLLMAVPFGTLAYMVIYGFFDRGGAAGALSLLMFFKIAAALCLVLAHQRFLQNKGLVLMILTSLVANVIVSFLHGLVPGFLVSITDAVAAIVVAVLAVVWAVVLLVGALVAVLKAIRLDRAA